MGELLGQKPLFPGKSEIDQLNKIFKELGKIPSFRKIGDCVLLYWRSTVWAQLVVEPMLHFLGHFVNKLRL